MHGLLITARIRSRQIGMPRILVVAWELELDPGGVLHAMQPQRTSRLVAYLTASVELIHD